MDSVSSTDGLSGAGWLMTGNSPYTVLDTLLLATQNMLSRIDRPLLVGIPGFVHVEHGY